MSDDSLITAIKDHKRGDEKKILDLENCREEMMTLTNLMGKNISLLEGLICWNIAEEAQYVAESAEKCITSMRSERERRQLTINPVSSEEMKYQSLIIFSGDVFPQHFYQWRRDVLNLKHLGISLATQGSYIMTFLKGEAKSRVEKELA